MTFYMLELHVADLAQSIAWYERTFGAIVAMSDDAHGFALLRIAKTRWALKRGTPTPGTMTPFVCIDDLEAFMARVPTSEIKASNEGYRRVFVTDPDGYRIGVFAWDEQADNSPY